MNSSGNLKKEKKEEKKEEEVEEEKKRKQKKRMVAFRKLIKPNVYLFPVLNRLVKSPPPV